ncbi:hypothetical protein N7462_004436 [Penicillium macrosclerotiorum]|uniref:uncharacterized protein n=1 Tax=Penicillium macrosclerotiorum TaxID=303699 RepID=UPI0025472748|nr:uncharacterized protein N7462_004436 [Penicillium macrosclerotiorum]KAJ5690044.1 hypothetical protein N7462_004436 [Penicillium macrosclerotiorum]
MKSFSLSEESEEHRILKLRSSSVIFNEYLVPNYVAEGGTILYHDDANKVTPLKLTDILIQDGKIVDIGPNLVAPLNAEIVDCFDKIISPGMIDTHHHLWQTQLKGRHAKDSLLDYFCNASMASHHYEADDIYWGQLVGALEAINTGTTFVLDHAHGCKTKEHANRALAATTQSGLRSIFAYANPTRLEKWDHDCCIPSTDMIPAEIIEHVVELAGKQPLGDGRIHIGFGFDYYFLPKQVIVGLFGRLRAAGVKLFTSHVVNTGIFATGSIVNIISDYGLLTTPSDILLSHCTGLNDQEMDILRETGIPVSTTPDTESKMAMGWPISFTPGIKYTFGVDCHTNNTASILQLARLAIGMARQQRALPVTAVGNFPTTMPATVEEAFNAATIYGAQAVGLGEIIGSIREGKQADLILFDTKSINMAAAAAFDPLVAVFNHSDVSDVSGVMIGGIWRKKDGFLTTVTADDGRQLNWDEIRKSLLKSQINILMKERDVSVEKARDLVLKMYNVDENKLVDILQN